MQDNLRDKMVWIRTGAHAVWEIRTLIAGAAGQVDLGSELVKKAGAASREQRIGTEKVSLAIAAMDGMAHQNAGLAQEVVCWASR